MVRCGFEQGADPLRGGLPPTISRVGLNQNICFIGQSASAAIISALVIAGMVGR
jgi:hypothetical protein